MTNDRPESFIGRWSRRKQEARDHPGTRPDTEPMPGEPSPDAAADPASKAANGTPPPDPLLTEADFADVDFASLDYASDYSRFLGTNVPDAIRNKALRQLWSSHPAMSEINGLDHYIDDYTDAAVAMPAGTIKTAYKIGQGFLTDVEAAAWDRLGKPEPKAADQEELAESVDAAVASGDVAQEVDSSTAGESVPARQPADVAPQSPAAHAAALADASAAHAQT